MISLFINLFITFRWLDAVDILLVAVLLYQLYNLVKGTVAINIFIGIALLYLLWIIVKALNMELFSTLLGKFIDVGVIAIIIVFQPELRRFLLFIGTSEFIGKNKSGKQFFSMHWRNRKRAMPLDIPSLVKACQNMAETKTGAIIVLTTKSELKFYANTGDFLDAKISTRIIESIFYKNSPLHDGAIIITNNRIQAARCVLPVLDNVDFPAHLGMRHRAAVGITENSDALAIVVSEQTGEISFVKEGNLKYGITPDHLKELLEKEFS
ncbi:MAG TPA: diadenylate cyclase CdaA [Bacteroidia bacterium]|nr:diadenylate cyclase CdaA [Bacteroidia bacterium]